MKIAIIGSPALDSLESNLCETFIYANHQCRIFDIYSTWPYVNSRLAKYVRTIDKIRRTYSDDYDKRVFIGLAAQVNDYNPDIVICVYRFIHPLFVKLVKKQSRKIIHINPDQLTTFEYQQVFASEYDVWFTKDPYIKNFMCNNLHLNAKLYNEAFNVRHHIKPNFPKIDYEKEYNIDVITYGTMYPYRCAMLKPIVDAGINIKVYGVKPYRFYNGALDRVFQNKYIINEEKARILYGAKIVFNQMHYAEIESVNNRFFEVNGAGAFQLSDYRPIMNDLLPIDPQLVSFKSIDEGIEKIKYYLTRPQERVEIAEKIYSHFINHYTYDHLIKHILSNI